MFIVHKKGKAVMITLKSFRRGAGMAVCWGMAVLAAAGGGAPSPREIIDFDPGWRFARFGPMPDGSRRPEPGKARRLFLVSASSEAPQRKGDARYGVDGDASTCWNAARRENQWLAVDFDEPQEISGVRIRWGFAGAPGYVVEIRDRRGRWKPAVKRFGNRREGEAEERFAPVRTRGVRVRITRVPTNGWPRICEMTPLDAEGRPLRDRVLEPKGGALTPASPDFDDSAWRRLDLPHDWGIEGPFRDDLDHATGLLPWKGIGWYRKRFFVPESDRNRRLYLDFDGAMANAEVFLNGRKVGGRPYGYASFRVDLTPALRPGETNVVAVRLDTVHWGSRWYPGAGIYRHVRLVKCAPLHIAHWGVQVFTPKVSANRAVVECAVTVTNAGSAEKAVTVRAAARSEDGKDRLRFPAVAVRLPPGTERTVRMKAATRRPRLWDIDHPNLYRLAARIETGDGAVLDLSETRFGLRSLRFTPRDGFYLNGRRVPIRGVCNHHDLGPLGAAVNRRALQRQLELLKEMGCNAIRTSHNPPAPDLLDLCDRMGFLVMDEAFDCWSRGKRPYDYGDLYDEWHEKDLRDLIRRDRNHPCVILWSIGNEVPQQLVAEMARELTDIVHDADPGGRPSVICCNNGRAGLSPTAQAVDVFGYNYNLGNYARFFDRPENRDTPLVASETSSCISSRGEYFFPPGKNNRVDFQVSSYDLDAPGWGCPPDRQFEMLDRFPAVLGEFVWTGFDYLGEPTPYNNDATVLLNFSDEKERERQRAILEKLGKIPVPSRSSYFGILDLCGFPKDRFYLYQARWRPDLPMVHILPHWNWPDRIGKVTPVHVYTSGDEVELFLNGKSLGRKKKGEYQYRLRWDDVVYQPGELRAVAYRNGKKWAETTVRTTGAPAALRLSADRARIRADGRDLSFITLRVVDKRGDTVPTADVPIRFRVRGAGRLAATGNGDPTCHIVFSSPERPTFNGLALLIVRSEAGKPGEILVEAESTGLKPATLRLEAVASAGNKPADNKGEGKP